MKLSTSPRATIFTSSKPILFFLSRFPDHFKRAIILVTLVAKVEKINPEDEEVLKAINATMDLVEKDGSLKIPVLMKDLLWVNAHLIDGEIRTIKANVQPSSIIHEYARRLVDLLPESIFYDTKETMEEDFCKVLRHSH